MKALLSFLTFILLGTGCTKSAPPSSSQPQHNHKHTNSPTEILLQHGLNLGTLKVNSTTETSVKIASFNLLTAAPGFLRVNNSPINNGDFPLTTSASCDLSSFPYHWEIHEADQTKNFRNEDIVGFSGNATITLHIDNAIPSFCEELQYKLIFEILSEAYNPSPSPTPDQGLAKVSPRPINLIDPDSEENFLIVYDQISARNFTYKVSMLIDGQTFGGGIDVSKIYLGIFDKTQKRYVSEWVLLTERPLMPLPNEFRLEFTIDKFIAPVYFIEQQRNMELHFALNEPNDNIKPFRTLDLQIFCNNVSNGFVEARTGARGCPP